MAKKKPSKARPAKFRVAVAATVPTKSKCFVGLTTVLLSAAGDVEVALFGSTKSQLLKACRAFCPSIDVDAARFQRVAYFRVEDIKRQRARS